MISLNQTNKHTSLSLQNIPIIAFSAMMVFMAFNNHSALFVSDYFIFLLLFAVTVFISAKKVVFNSFSVSISVLLVLLLLLSIINYKTFDSGTFKSYLIWFLTLLLVPSIAPKKEQIFFIFDAFLLGSLICSLLMIVTKHEYLYSGFGRFTIQILGNEEIDPNYLATFLYIGFSFGLIPFIKKKIFLVSKILRGAVLLLVLYAIVLTGSRAAYICVAIGIIGFLAEVMKTRINRKMVFVFLIIALVIIVLMASNAFGLSESIVERFNLNSLMDSSNSNRLNHWLDALYCFFKRPFGYGASHTKTILLDVAGVTADAHNTFITILLQFGIIGFVVFFAWSFRIFKVFFQRKQFYLIFFIVSFLFNALIIANHLGIDFWGVFIVLYWYGNIIKKERV